MSLRCRPGDLCVIVGGEPRDMNLLGRFIRVTKLDHDWHVPVWRYKGPKLRDLEGTPIGAFCDVWLRPIRDPGDDAVDEISLVRRKTEEDTA